VSIKLDWFDAVADVPLVTRPLRAESTDTVRIHDPSRSVRLSGGHLTIGDVSSPDTDPTNWTVLVAPWFSHRFHVSSVCLRQPETNHDSWGSHPSATLVELDPVTIRGASKLWSEFYCQLARRVGLEPVTTGFLQIMERVLLATGLVIFNNNS
jgi:hypothetical protein